MLISVAHRPSSRLQDSVRADDCPRELRWLGVLSWPHAGTQHSVPAGLPYLSVMCLTGHLFRLVLKNGFPICWTSHDGSAVGPEGFLRKASY
jgi:hypothetical protein